MLRNFMYNNVCGCSGDWKMDSFVENNVKALRERIGDNRCCAPTTGGVIPLCWLRCWQRLSGKQLTCVFVDRQRLAPQSRKGRADLFLFVLAGHGLKHAVSPTLASSNTENPPPAQAPQLLPSVTFVFSAKEVIFQSPGGILRLRRHIFLLG